MCGNLYSYMYKFHNLYSELEQSQRTNESLHSKLGQLSVHLSNVQHTSNQNAQQNISLKEVGTCYVVISAYLRFLGICPISGVPIR